MFFVLLLLGSAASPVKPASQAELVEQARRCGLSMQYIWRDNRGSPARLSDDGRELLIIDNAGSREQVSCLLDWATQRGITAVRMRD